MIVHAFRGFRMSLGGSFWENHRPQSRGREQTHNMISLPSSVFGIHNWQAHSIAPRIDPLPDRRPTLTRGSPFHGCTSGLLLPSLLDKPTPSDFLLASSTSEASKPLNPPVFWNSKTGPHRFRVLPWDCSRRHEYTIKLRRRQVLSTNPRHAESSWTFLL